MARNFISGPISDVAGIAVDTSIFPDRAKRASVAPIGKGGNGKCINTNFRPVSALNNF